MTTFRPRYITFDCYGTLTNFQMAEAARDLYSEQLDESRMAEFIKNFAAYRLDEILGHWKPYAEVVHNSLERTCKRNGMKFREEAARLVYERVPTWGPHPDVPAGLARVAKEIPLVILSNAMNSQEVGAPFFGGMLSKKSAMMHMGRYVVGLAEAATRYGATIFEQAAVTEHRQEGGRHALKTPRGNVTADAVLVATGAYTPSTFGYFRRRIIAVGSFIIATRPLTAEEIEATMPGNRTCVTSMNIGNYFRLSPDNRLIFGGRARFSATSDQRSDAKSGAILKASLAEIFPQLANVGIDYCWGGLVDMTKDRFPRAGYHDGVWYAMGYSGHGAQLSTHLGMIMADAILDRPDRNPLKGLEWPAVPGHFGKPWFLPLVGMYYKMLDRFR
ncbi:FAD-dependent oxidoreductase [Sinorhizobium medicae]|nr:FAD-dependent oxidoreductase [Sinorhizobium medicae]